MASKILHRLIEEYLDIRRKQEADHTDPVLNYQREEAHDAMMLRMDMERVVYSDREDAARVARIINRRA